MQICSEETSFELAIVGIALARTLLALWRHGRGHKLLPFNSPQSSNEQLWCTRLLPVTRSRRMTFSPRNPITRLKLNSATSATQGFLSL